MTQEPQEKWQRALEHWDTWSNAIKKARAEIIETHGSLSDLVRQSRIELPELPDGTEIRYSWQIDKKLSAQYAFTQTIFSIRSKMANVIEGLAQATNKI